jgi:hypothetical protein
MISQKHCFFVCVAQAICSVVKPKEGDRSLDTWTQHVQERACFTEPVLIQSENLMEAADTFPIIDFGVKGLASDRLGRSIGLSSVKRFTVVTVRGNVIRQET